MQAVNSLQELLEVLPKSSGSDFIQIANGLKIDAQDVEPYAFWSKDSYTRNCIARNEDYELILICWEPGQETAIHCHNGEECWVYGVKGELEEIRYKSTEKSEDHIYESERQLMLEGKSAYMHDRMGYHSLHNRTEQRAMTLHLYVNPIDSCRIYDVESQVFVRKTLQYTTLKGKLL